MSVADAVAPKKDKRSKTHHGEPRDPDVVLTIIAWRDIDDLTWQEIGKRLDMTRAGARHLYYEWYEWYQHGTIGSRRDRLKRQANP